MTIQERPTRPCWSCGSDKWEKALHGGYVCSVCHPPPNKIITEKVEEVENDKNG
jgi:hypothetical protein